jgi:hypothetical protein
VDLTEVRFAQSPDPEADLGGFLLGSCAETTSSISAAAVATSSQSVAVVAAADFA